MLIVNEESCVNCGICSEICPSGSLRNGKNGPELLLSQACLACGHCVAICPNEALDLLTAPKVNQVKVERFPVIDADTAATFLRSRRSIRSYKQEKVSREALLQLLDIARFAPSGSNLQGLSYIVYESPELLKRIKEVTVDWLEGLLEEQIQKGAKSTIYESVVSVYRNTGEDVVLRGAPQLIVAIAPNEMPTDRGRDNGHFSLSYLELYATTLGLGTCWAGLMERCAQNKYKPLLELLNMPQNMSVAGAVMVGYPKYTFPRLVDRNPLNVTWQ